MRERRTAGLPLGLWPEDRLKPPGAKASCRYGRPKICNVGMAALENGDPHEPETALSSGGPL